MGYFRIDIKNFDQTIFDTSDLSTIRGASFAANLLPKYLYMQCGGEDKRHNDTRRIIIDGASTLLVQCENAAKIEGKVRAEIEGKVRDELAKLREMTPDEIQSSENNQETLLGYVAPHLCILTASSEKENFSEALDEISIKMARAQQTAMGGDIITPGHSRDKCAIDSFRPAQTKYYMPGDETNKPSHVSYASATRREMGRSARRRDYYLNYLRVCKIKLDEFDFTNTFEEIVQLSDAQRHLIPHRLQNKVCVFAMDMTGLSGSAKTEEGRGANAFAQWSANQVLAQKNILKAITETALEKTDLWATEIEQYNATQNSKVKTKALRLETLMLGGDECLAIFPAWCLEDVVKAINNVKDVEFPFGSGFVIAPSKTPLRQLKEIAATLCENSKRGGADFGLQYHITGHIDATARRVLDDRDRLFGTRSDSSLQNNDIALWTWKLANFARVFEEIRLLKGDGETGIAHSRLVKAIFKALNDNEITENSAKIASVALEYNEKKILGQNSIGDPVTIIDIVGSSKLNGNRGIIPDTGRETLSQQHGFVPHIHLAMLWSFVMPKPILNSADETASGENQGSTEAEPAS